MDYQSVCVRRSQFIGIMFIFYGYFVIGFVLYVRLWMRIEMYLYYDWVYLKLYDFHVMYVGNVNYLNISHFILFFGYC